MVVFPPTWQRAFDPKVVVTDICLAGKFVHDRWFQYIPGRQVGA